MKTVQEEYTHGRRLTRAGWASTVITIASFAAMILFEPYRLFVRSFGIYAVAFVAVPMFSALSLIVFGSSATQHALWRYKKNMGSDAEEHF
jgi:hypothetical protein